MISIDLRTAEEGSSVGEPESDCLVDATAKIWAAISNETSDGMIKRIRFMVSTQFEGN